MKKIKNILLVILMFMVTITLTGCGTKKGESGIKPSEAIKKASEVMSKADNFKINMKIDLSATLNLLGEETTVDIPIIVNGNIDTKNKATYISTTLKSLLGYDLTKEEYIYYDSTTNEFVLYDNDGAGWITARKAIQNYDPTLEYGKNIMDLIVNSSNMKELASDDNYYNYEVELTKENIEKLLSISNENSKPYIDIKNGAKVKISLSKKDYALSAISFDLKDIVDQKEGTTYTKSTFILTISDYGTVGDVTVPEEVKSNAQNFYSSEQ